MTIYVELTTEPFEDVLNAQKARKTREHRSARAGRRLARRPTRGLEIKEDTAAAIKVIQADGSEIPLVDSSSPDGNTKSGYANFILQNVSEQRMEKHQIVETFGESYIFFFGESPRFLNVNAILVNSHDFNWEAEWWENYERYFRGTKLVELGARLYMFYDDNIVEGYMLNSSAVKVAEEPFLIRMSFMLYLTNYRNVSFVGNPNFPIRASVALPPGVQLTSGRAGEDLVNKFNAAALDQIQNVNVGDTGNEVKRIINSDGIGAKSRLSAFLREIPPTFAIAPDVEAAIRRIADTPLGDSLHDLAVRLGKPLRTVIAANIDEYVGAPQNNAYFSFEPGKDLPTSLSPTIRDHLEVQDLFKAAIDFLSCYGADIDNPDALGELGLMARVDAVAGATFTPEGEAVAFADASAEASATSGAFSRQRDPLGAVYGEGSHAFASASAFAGADAQDGAFAFAEASAGASANAFVQGAGDSQYGYRSDGARGAGFGGAGFGAFGGAGFGSGQGAGGDPGFRDPSRFTAAGVSDNRSAFSRFVKPKLDETAFGTGIGVGASTTGLTGSAAFGLKGRASAFAVVSVEGELNPFGEARVEADFQSDIIGGRALGFLGANLAGTRCPAPGPFATARTLSTGSGAHAEAFAAAGFSGAGVEAGAYAGASAGVGANASAQATASAGAGVSVP